MSGLSRTPGKRVYGESRTAGSNPALSAKVLFNSLKISIHLKAPWLSYHILNHISAALRAFSSARAFR